MVAELLGGFFPVTLQARFYDRHMLLEGCFQTEIGNISCHIAESLILRLDRIVASVQKFVRACGHDQCMEPVVEVIE